VDLHFEVRRRRRRRGGYEESGGADGKGTGRCGPGPLARAGEGGASAGEEARAREREARSMISGDSKMSRARRLVRAEARFTHFGNLQTSLPCCWRPLFLILPKK
jgi:hypothetical protein